MTETLNARSVPVGAVADVFGFTDPDDWRTKEGGGAFHSGRVRLVESREGFLNTAVTFEDGVTVYCRSYAVARVTS